MEQKKKRNRGASLHLYYVDRLLLEEYRNAFKAEIRINETLSELVEDFMKKELQKRGKK